MSKNASEPNDPASNSDHRPGSSLSFWQIVGSTMAAALGIQKKANRERDFTHGKPIHFITAGVIFTVSFVIVIILVVRIVISAATG